MSPSRWLHKSHPDGWTHYQLGSATSTTLVLKLSFFCFRDNQACIDACMAQGTCTAVLFDPDTSTCHTGDEALVTQVIAGTGAEPGWTLGATSWDLTTFDSSYVWTVASSVRQQT